METSDMKKETKYDFFLIALLIIGTIVLIIGVFYHPGPASIGLQGDYANLAENIVKGKGFVLDYIDEYYVKFDSVTHPLEWDYPMMGILLVPSIFVLGKTSLAATLPGMIIGTILFPILVYYLGKEFFDKQIGFLAAVSMLFFWKTFELIFNGYRDVPFAFFALAGIYFFYKGLKEDQEKPLVLLTGRSASSSKYFYLMGIFLGIAYLTRPTALIIVPTLVLAHYVITKKLDFKFTKGMLVALLVVSPWLIRTYLLFGNPLFTANKYAQWIFTWFTEYEHLGYQVYWDAQKPSFSWLVSLPLPPSVRIVIIDKILNNFTVQLEEMMFLVLAAFIGIVITIKEKIARWLVILTAVVPALAIAMELIVRFYLKKQTIYLPFLVLPYALILITLNFVLAKENYKLRILALLWTAFALLHGFIVLPDVRFFLTLLPFFFIFGWAGLKRILELLSRDYKIFKTWNAQKILALLLVVFIFFNLWFAYRAALRPNTESVMPTLIERATEKDAVIMACHVGHLNFFTGRKFVELPGDAIGKVVEVIKLYNVNYITFADCSTRLIDPLLWNGLFGQSGPPEGYSNLLYKIKLEELEQRGKETIITLNPLLVAGTDKNGKKFWTTSHLT